MVEQMKEKRWKLLLILGALTAMVPLTIDMYLPAFPALTEELNTTSSLTQVSLTASLFGIAAGQLVIGSLSDVYGRKRPLLIATILFVIASILIALSPNIWVLIVLRFAQGFAGAGGIVISRSIIRDLYDGAAMTKMFTLLILVLGLAPILAPLIGGQLLTFTNWRGIFVILACFGILLSFIAAFKIQETLPPRYRSEGGLKATIKVFLNLAKQRPFIGFAFIQGFTAAYLFSYISGSSFILQEVFELSPQMYGILFSVNALGFTALSQVSGKLVDYYNEEKLMVGGFCIAIFGGLTLMFAAVTEAGLIPVLIGLFFIISSVGVINPTSLSLAMQTQTKNIGSASALLGLFQFLMGGIAAPLVGLAGTNAVMPLALVILTCQVGVIISYLTFVRKKV
ncbi:multidrug effflux MFS transporter [Halalkalibacillus halophilus]|uniref:multidrug effflux MFS transporter n=1 Tax=Halalkalibacillus halophilus TaxID=392827 RepID=UPI0003F763A2|nr:multidrug effflux MFS transporter [Halalkalibacillus halophilus]